MNITFFSSEVVAEHGVYIITFREINVTISSMERFVF